MRPTRHKHGYKHGLLFTFIYSDAFLPRGHVKWRKLRQAHYHSTTYIKCYGNIIHFISSYTFPQLPLQLLCLNKMLNSRASVTAAGSSSSTACVYLYACVHVSVCDVNSRAQCGEISLWLYLVNAAAADKSFISLILRYRPCRPCYTLPLQFTQSAQHKDTATLPPSLSLALFLPLSVSHPLHPTFASPPSSGHSRQYVCLTLANQRFTLDAQMEKKGKGKSKH